MAEGADQPEHKQKSKCTGSISLYFQLKTDGQFSEFERFVLSQTTDWIFKAIQRCTSGKIKTAVLVFYWRQCFSDLAHMNQKNTQTA